LISCERYGRVFQTDSLDSLADAIWSVHQMGKVSAQDREAIRQYSHRFSVPRWRTTSLRRLLGLFIAAARGRLRRGGNPRLKAVTLDQ